MFKVVIILSCSFLAASGILFAQEKAPAENQDDRKEENANEPKIVIDGKLDEYRADLLDLLEDVEYDPFVIAKESRVMYDFEQDWVKFVMENAFSQFAKMTAEDEKFVKASLYMTVGRRAARGFHPQTDKVWRYVMDGIRSRDEANSHTLPTLVASMGIIFSEEHVNKIKQHADYEKLGDLGKFLTIRGHRTEEQMNRMITILGNDKINSIENSEFIRHEVMRIYTTRKNKNALERLWTTPKLPETIKHTILGIRHVQAAWKIRGKAFAHKVPQKNMEAFHNGLIDARNSLVQAWSLDKKNIHAIRELITVAMADGEGDLRMWLDRGLNIYMDDHELLYNYSYAMEPKWSGSVPELLGIAVAASLTDREGSRLPIFAITTLNKVNGLIREQDIFESPLFNWLRLENAKKMTDTNFSGSRSFLGDYISLADKDDRLDLLMPYYDQIMANKEALRLTKPLLNKIELFKLGAMDLIEVGHQLYLDGKYFEVVSLYEQSVKKWPKIKQSPEVFRDFVAPSHCNYWIQNKPNTKVTLPSDNSVMDCRIDLLDKEKTDFTLGYYDIETYPEYSISMNFSLVKGVTLLKKFSKPMNAGVLVGLKSTDDENNPYEFIGCNLELISDGKAKLRLTRNFEEFKVIDVDTVKTPKGERSVTAKLKLHVVDDKLSVFVNGREFIKEMKLKELEPIEDENGEKFYGKVGYYSLPERKQDLAKDHQVDFTLIKKK